MSNSTAPGRRTSPMWLAVGLAIGLLVAPAAAVAATITAVNLVGPNGVKAQVTKAGQLETVTAPPTQTRVFYDLNLHGSACRVAYTAPPGYSLILQQVSVDVFGDTTPGTADSVALATDSACHNQLFDDNPSSVGAITFPLGTGIVIPAGHSIYAIARDNIDAEIYGYGYVVPAGQAPTATVPSAG